LKQHTLTIAGGQGSVRLAVFSGPGFGRPLLAATRQTLAASGAQVAIMLGGLGGSTGEVGGTLRTLAGLQQPVVFVAGGRDRWPLLEEAFSRLPDDARIIDATSLHEIRIGHNTFVPVAGAESGRYALDSSACGFGERDLAALAQQLGPLAPAEVRWLLSWQAAAAGTSVGVTRTDRGADTGSFALRHFMNQAGVRGGLHAWPAVQAARPQASPQGILLQLVVPRLWGPRLERDDGSRPTLGFAQVTVDAAGLHLGL
jgi:hypothetical protein